MLQNQIIHPLIDISLIVTYPFVYSFRFIKPFLRVIIVFLIFFICVIMYAAGINICQLLISIYKSNVWNVRKRRVLKSVIKQHEKFSFILPEIFMPR